MLGSVGWEELLLVLLILGLVFGASRVAEIGGALGRGVREFRAEVQRGDDEPSDGDEASTGASPLEEPPQDPEHPRT